MSKPKLLGRKKPLSFKNVGATMNSYESAREKELMENLEVNEAINKSWAFTIKKLGGEASEVCEDDYINILDTFSKAGQVTHAIHETDPKGRLHVHGVILLRKGFYRKMLCLQGFHVKLDELYNESGWIRYIKKDCPDQQFDNKEYAF